MAPSLSGTRFWPVAVEHAATVGAQVIFTSNVLAQAPVPPHSFRQWTVARHVPAHAAHFGVREVSGEFERGAVVACVDPAGREIARGLANYSAAETRRIMGRPSGEIEAILGYVDEPELINRDNLVLL